MLVLLPPSEGKAAPARGRPLDLDTLSLPDLAAPRREVLTALAELCRADPQRALDVLGLSARQADEVARDAELEEAPTAPAASVYSGVLYQALGHHEASPAARRRLDRWVLVWSGLWGAVRLTDRIPAYRLAGSVALPPLGPLPAYWRPHLATALAPLVEGQVVLDLRSGTYASSWTGPGATTVVGRVVHEAAGTRTVASHFNKATKGRLVRALAEQGGRPRTADQLVEAIRAAGFRVEWAEPAEPAEPAGPPGARSRRPAVLDIVVDAL